ncbi:MAG: DMT family transporter [Burkholderiaceae bacterium]|nr:MAG: DMT family transporter [Burkholderiaceae bacterium]
MHAFLHDPKHRFALGLTLGLIGAILFSAKAIVVKLAYRYGVDAATLLALRMAFALPFFVVIAVLLQRRAPVTVAPRQWGQVIGIGLLGYYAASFLDFLGLQYVSAALERLTLFIYPTLVLLFARLLYGRTITRLQWWAMGVSYCGIALAFAHDVRLAQPNLWLGGGLVFASAVTYALYLLFGGELLRQIGTLRMTALASIVAAFACIAQFLVLRDWAALQLPWQVYALSVFNAMFCTVIPVFCVMLSIEFLTAGVAAQISMVGPMSTLLMGGAILGETITAWHVLGTACVLAGIFMLSWQARKTI